MSRKKSYLSFFLSGFPERVREIRGSLTQEQLGKIIGVNQGTVYKYEKGAALPGDETLKKLADFGGVTVEWLLRGERPPAPAREHAPETYEVRPAELDVPALAEIIALAREFLKRRREKLSDRQAARLLADLYWYWQTEKRLPDDHVLAAYLPLARREAD